MNLRKITAVLVAGCMSLLSLTACGGAGTTSGTNTTGGTSTTDGNTSDGTGAAGSAADANGNIIKIGVFEAASGDNGASGKQETLGYEYAQSLRPTVDIGGVPYTVQLEYVDNESSTDKAATAASQLISKGISAALGSYGSAVCIAGSQTFADAGVPIIASTSTNPQVTLDNTHYFRICFLDPFQGTVLASFAKDQFTAKKAYVLAKLGDDYSVGLATYFKLEFEKLGGEVVYETFPEGNSDFNSYINNAKSQGCDVFFSPTSTEAAALIIEQAAAQQLTMPILAGDTWDSNVITEAAKGKDITLYITTFYQEGSNPEFDEGFKAWLHANSDKFTNNNNNDQIAAASPLGFDSYNLLLDQISAAGSTDSKAINDALWNANFDGVAGHVEFDENGDAKRSEAVVKKVNTETGAWDFVTTQSVA